MKIPNKRDLHQIPYNYSSDIGNLFKKRTPKPCSFLVIDAFLALRFRKNVKTNPDNWG